MQPDGPAAKAGVRPFDVLLKGNDRPLATLDDLMKLIDQVKGGELKLDLLRGGKAATVTVVPTKRPAPKPGDLGKDWSDAAVSGLRDIGPLEFRVIRPGQILPAPPTTENGNATFEVIVHATSKLADGTSIDITRHGSNPAKVVVTRDKEKWEGTSDDLSKVPERVRPEVQKLLESLERTRFSGVFGPGDGSSPLLGGSGIAGIPIPPGLSPDMEKRLHEMQKQIDELRQSVKKLQDKN